MSDTIRVFEKANASDFFHAASAVEDWINGGMKVNEETKTVAWSAFPDDPDAEAGYEDLTLYGGQAGQIFFRLELYQSTKDESYLQAAIRGGDSLLQCWDCGNPIGNFHDYPLSCWGLVLGRSGVGFVFAELGEISGEKRFSDFALSIAERVAEEAVVTQHGVKWCDKSGVVYDAGIILYLLYAAEKFHQDTFKAIAIQGGRELLHKAIPMKENSSEIVRWETIDPGIGLPADGEAPNFYYGTAGNAYTLAVLYEQTREYDFLDYARKGTAYMESIALGDSRRAVIPMYVPAHAEKTPHYIGICNGYAGTVRLFYQMYKITGEQHYRDFADQLTDGVLALGAPERHFLGYWNTDSICCGAAALVNAFLGLYQGFKDKKYLELAERTGQYLLGESTEENDKLKWYQAYMRLNPMAIDARAGYYDGAAGIAAQLLHLSEALEGKLYVIRQPDEPYPTQ